MERDVLLKDGCGSADGSMRHLARVWSGSRGESKSRACRALSLADCRDDSGGGEGRLMKDWRSGVLIEELPRDVFSFSAISS